MSDAFDYIIVGAGSAGCILAERLSADRKASVLVLEAGGPARHPLLHIPQGVGKVWNRPDFNWNYFSDPEPFVDGRRLYHSRGKVVGGSAAINMMAYVRGNPSDFDRWAQKGLSGWSYRQLLPYFRRNETFLAGGDEFRGDSGPIPVRTLPADDPLGMAWRRAGATAGYPVTPDYNGRNQEGFDCFQFNIGKGRRANSAKRFLEPALARGNVSLETGALVERIVFDGLRATGIAYRAAGQQRQATARREVILSAGAYNSPQILMLSGIGPADHLQALGIPVVADRRDVGGNLQDHPAFGIDYARKMPSNLLGQLRWDRLLRNLARAWAFGTGPATLPLASGTAFIRSGPEMALPDLQLIFRGYSREIGPWFPGLGPRKPDGVGVSVCHLRPMARGTVRLQSADPGAAPRILNNFLADETDRRVMRKAFHICRTVMEQPSFDFVRGEETIPGTSVRSDADIDAYIRKTLGTVFHPCGTARAGTDSDSVVDPELRVRGVTNLRVIDASIFPDIVGGNLNATVMVTADKGADLILGRSPPSADERIEAETLA